MNARKLEKYLSMPGALAFSVGTSVGWGSLVVTANTYLVQAGPFGSVAGLVVGVIVMLLIGISYAYLMQSYPDCGGAYSFTKEIFGYDHGFMTAWFVAMTYLAILWANATSLPLFGRIFLGETFRFVKLYTIFGYDVYLGEALLSIAAIIIVSLLCMSMKKLTGVLMIVLVSVFTLGIIICFAASMFAKDVSMTPYFVKDSSALTQIARIAVISPWAFIGFESISHASEECLFPNKKFKRLMIISVLVTLALYVMVTLLSITAYPAGYANWFEYISDLDNLSGLEALPPFFAANHYLGNAGVILLMLALLSLIITSLIGNITALSRLFYSMAKDHMLPLGISKLNKKNIPSNAVLLVTAISVLIPFTGRTAIGWIVDVTTIGAILIYGVVSAAAVKLAREAGDRRIKWIGRIGLVVMLVFGGYILITNFIFQSTIAKETFLLFIAWSVFGFIFFRIILKRDKERHFGSSIIVWVALLSLVLFISFVWMRQSMISSDIRTETNVESYYGEHDKADSEDLVYVKKQLKEQEGDTTKTMLMVMGMFGFVLVILLTNHSYMNRRSVESEVKANTDSMTGVKNKHAFMIKEAEINAAIHDGTVRDFAIAVCDVNGLKKINDTCGHKAGDEYIITSCKMVCDIFQHSPVYRVGGDEFAVMISGRDYNMRNELMRLLHERSVEHIDTGGAVISGGLSDYIPNEDENFHTVFERADSRMYENKKLLKSLGAVTRDEEEEKSVEEARAEKELFAFEEEMAILKVRRNILIVEDEMINREILGNVLSDDYEILYASDGIEALEQINDNKDDIALIMLDLMMPRMGGAELMARLKENDETSDIPIIVLTADQQSEVECLRLGAMDFVQKPYPAAEIIRARVNKCVELTEDRSMIRETERDNLTGLFNIEYFARYVDMFDRHYHDVQMDAAVLDVNHFHMINERYGKEYGDRVLKAIGIKVRQTARKIGGVGCRQGADTFLIYCPHNKDYENLLETIYTGLKEADKSFEKIHLRLGVYYNADKDMDIERRFDRAKYAADNVRGNYIKEIGEYDSELHNSMIFKERLLEDFESSLENGHFLVYLQPKFDVRKDKPTLASAEALVRWDHPELGMISPGLFIPLLEEYGLILELDHYVWEKTAAEIARWKREFNFWIPVSVNVSRIDMLMHDIKDLFTDILERNTLTPDDIILEITESAYTGDSEQVISVAAELRSMGLMIEMDDFGTGYSSLGMLSHLPIDALKMDMSFVRSAFADKKDMKMIELILDIAKYLEVPVVAEGVETGEQYITLKKMGCDIVQGYYFSRPVPFGDFEKFISTNRT